AVDGVEIDVLHLSDTRIAKRILVDQQFHRFAETPLICVFVECSRTDDQRLFVREQRNAAVKIASPSLRLQVEGESEGEDAFNPALQNGGKADEVDRRDEGQRLRARHLRLLRGDILWPAYGAQFRNDFPGSEAADQ